MSVHPPSVPEPRSSDQPHLDKSGQRVREMFRQIAPRYDAMNHLLSLNIDRRWRRKAVDRLRIESESPVLDICCGTGDLAIAIADRAGSGVQVIGSDFCHAMLEIARDKETARVRSAAGGNGRPTIPFFEADSMSLPFVNERFQCVTVAFGLRNIADTDQGLSEMVRVCRPGGQVMVLEFSQPSLPILKQLYGFYFRSVLPRVGQLLASNDKSAYSYLPASVGQFPCGEKLAERMRAAGLREVEFHPLTLGVATIYVGNKPPDERPAGDDEATSRQPEAVHA
ncbi:bifunctional demethylmenaquinone methyltransferase/2-methoxy-6-polyprenyl-1,4-benzoquinol methylase UbiE [Allorhodopirellula solitaria]|uniref:Demethylmenaquinone methyltransferase n=1 Tax=Allorhodopirellula solitaria TaxID=2527987 RepID=A0A5C5YHI1_9BACT|nr:bifunctional demethylmenaquinone methyltransferase/2-methoxy-6-polyprenyl-1,4-benzoquinol methylase UbiE [Allorhodopirellula solitaria]TWT74211.1 UbiE/COQ5 methyltransferase [Allorhodopirellula solitaria]